jgi:hypothetical protein
MARKTWVYDIKTKKKKLVKPESKMAKDTVKSINKGLKSIAKKVGWTGTGKLMTAPRNTNSYRVRKYISMQYNRSYQICTSGTGVNLLGNIIKYSSNNLNKPYFQQLATDPLPYGFYDTATDWKSFKVHGLYLKLALPPNVVGKHIKLVISFENSSGQGALVAGQDYQNFIGQPNTFVLSTSMDDPTVFSKKISIARLEGLTKQQYRNSLDVKWIGNYNGSAGTFTDDPKSAMNINIALVNTFDNTAQCFEGDLQITYYVENITKLVSAKAVSTN